MSSKRKDKPVKYVLPMFPYTSGSLHVGHLRVYSLSDYIARSLRVRGEKVLHPIGWDSFGIPTQTAATYEGFSPAMWIKRNSQEMKNVLRAADFDFDWEREFYTSEVRYYRWTQRLFLLLYDRGMVYRKKGYHLFCEKCETVLSEEEGSGGRCWRCGSPLKLVESEEWYVRTSLLAKDLYDALEGPGFSGWSRDVIMDQKRWIGRSEGVRIEFRSERGKILAFTRVPEFLGGATFLALSPFTDQLDGLALTSEERRELESLRSEIMSEYFSSEPRGMKLEFTVENPVTGDEMPVFVADFVLHNFGTGCTLGIPFYFPQEGRFAEHFGIPIKHVLHDGVVVNSGELDGLSVREARERVIRMLEDSGSGRIVTYYRLRDWMVSRWNWWGTPVPAVVCPECGVSVLSPDELPVYVGERTRKCPKCKKLVPLEPKSLTTLFDSCWYFLRFADPSEEEMFGEKVENVMPVDYYVGGREHSILHLLYARFITRFLWKEGFLPDPEPFDRFLSVGKVTVGGKKMSKSSGNRVDMKDLLKEKGSDVARIYVLAERPFWKELEYSPDDMRKYEKFVRRVRGILETLDGELKPVFALFPCRSGLSRELKSVAEELLENCERCFGRNKFHHVFSLLYRSLKRIERAVSSASTVEELAWCKVGFSVFAVLLWPFAPKLGEEVLCQLGFSYPHECYEYCVEALGKR